jgi:hypothetical protein
MATYEVKFATELPDAGFTVDWLKWEHVEVQCHVPGPASAVASAKATITGFDTRFKGGVEFYDSQAMGQAAEIGGAVISNVLSGMGGPIGSALGGTLGISTAASTMGAGSAASILEADLNGVSFPTQEVRFIVRAKETKEAIEAARAHLKSVAAGKAGDFFLRVRLQVEGPGSPPKMVPSAGKALVNLEPPRLVIWSDEPDDEYGEKRITVDTSKEDPTEFRINLYRYNAKAGEYEPTSEVLEVTKSSDFPVGFTVEAEAGKMKVKSERVIVGDRLLDGASLKGTKIGDLSVKRKEGSKGSTDLPPINEPFKISVYYKAIADARLEVKVLAKQCFACGTALAQKQEACGSCEATAIRGNLETNVPGEKIELQFPNLPPRASDYLYLMWKITLPPGIRPSPSFQTEYKCEEFQGSGDEAPQADQPEVIA